MVGLTIHISQLVRMHENLFQTGKEQATAFALSTNIHLKTRYKQFSSVSDFTGKESRTRYLTTNKKVPYNSICSSHYLSAHLKNHNDPKTNTVIKYLLEQNCRNYKIKLTIITFERANERNQPSNHRPLEIASSISPCVEGNSSI